MVDNYCIDSCFCEWNHSNNIDRKNKKRKELELYKLLIVEWVKDSKNHFDRYTLSLGEFAQKIKDSDSLDKVPYVMNLLCIQKLNSLPIEKLTDALLLNLKVETNDKSSLKEFFNLVNQLEFIEKNDIQIKSIYEKYSKESELLLDEFNSQYIPLTNDISENYFDVDTTTIERKFYEFALTYQRSIVEFQKLNREIPRSKFMTEFIDPVYQYGVNNPIDFANSKRIQKTMKILNEIKIVNIKYINHAGFGDLFRKMNEKMIKAQSILFKSIEYYDTHNIKSICGIK